MKMFLVLAGCVALACSTLDAQSPQSSPGPKKKPTQTIQHATGASGQAMGAGGWQQRRAVTPMGRPTVVGRGQVQGKPTTMMTRPTTMMTRPATTTWQTQTNLSDKVRLAASGQAQHFDLAKKSSQPVTGVTFKQGRHIPGSQNWKGSNFTAFRNFTPQWHDAGWWRLHHNRIVNVVVVINEIPFNNFFFFDSGFWFPAWGYDPNSIYPYDGPTYGYNGLSPDQVVANVQAALQAQGYYYGPVDGILGPLTRAALADYQRDHGLYITAAVDQPTMASLGFV